MGEPTDLELEMLDKRRTMEHDLVLLADGQKPPFWFCISLKWLAHWKDFVLDEPTNSHCDQKLGVLPPGPITN